ncbi:MAG: hypothetical protein AB7Q81_06915 [Gammaproteobacteria bacterium]
MPCTNKVADVTAMFWLMKITATTLGETAGDLLSMTLGLGYLASSAFLLGLFVAALTLQLRATRFHPALYWTVIVATSTAGTTLSDYLDRSVGLGYLGGAALLASLLAAVLWAWHRGAGTLAVDHIARPRDEAFYWLAILVSNTLGTALGDYLADDSGLGFAGGAAVIGSALVVLLTLRLVTRCNRVLLFWLAFVLTRPFGATCGDFLSKSPAGGGLGFGTIGSSLVLSGLLLAGLAVQLRQMSSP